MFRMYLNRLILPILFVAGLIALPFLWLPSIGPPGGKEAPAQSARAGARRRKPTAFQGVMTIGFALILISVTAGGVLLYRITREQSAGWRRRFAPRKKGVRPAPHGGTPPDPPPG